MGCIQQATWYVNLWSNTWYWKPVTFNDQFLMCYRLWFVAKQVQKSARWPIWCWFIVSSLHQIVYITIWYKQSVICFKPTPYTAVYNVRMFVDYLIVRNMCYEFHVYWHVYYSTMNCAFLYTNYIYKMPQHIK